MPVAYVVNAQQRIMAFHATADGLTPFPEAEPQLPGPVVDLTLAAKSSLAFALLVPGAQDDRNALVTLRVSPSGALEPAAGEAWCAAAGSWPRSCRADPRLAGGGDALVTDASGRGVYVNGYMAATTIPVSAGGLGRAACIAQPSGSRQCIGTRVLGDVIASLTLSPDGRRLYIASGDTRRGVEVFDVSHPGLPRPYDCIQEGLWFDDGLEGCGPADSATAVDRVLASPTGPVVYGISSVVVAGFAPALGIPDQRLEAKGGRTSVRVHCPTELRRCSGRLRLVTSADSVGGDEGRHIRIGEGRFALAGGRSATFAIAISKSGLRRLVSHGRLIAQVQAFTVTPGGGRRSARALRLSVPRGRAHVLLPPKTCVGLHGYRIVAKQPGATIFKALWYAELTHELVQDTFGCYRDGHPVLLADADLAGNGYTFVGPVAIAGPLAAFGTHFWANEGADGIQNYYLHVVDLRTGHVLHEVCPDRGTESCNQDMDRIVLTRNGATAFSYTTTDDSGRKVGVVSTLGRSQARPRLVARGRSVAARSLVLRRGQIYWREGARLRSAPFR
jgi:hypothetical protein